MTLTSDAKLLRTFTRDGVRVEEWSWPEPQRNCHHLAWVPPMPLKAVHVDYQPHLLEAARAELSRAFDEVHGG